MRRRIAARVEDFPDPAGPVIRISPWGSSASSDRTVGSSHSSRVGNSFGTRRNTADSVPRWWNTVARKREMPKML